jgi:hypothetical protein
MYIYSYTGLETLLGDMTAAAGVSTGGSLLMYSTLTQVDVLGDVSAAAGGAPPQEFPY